MKERFQKLFSKQYHLPGADKLQNAIEAFSPTEKAFFFAFAGIFALSGIFLALKANRAVMVEVPTSGGSFVEGVVGSPHLSNPLFALSEADRDIVSLVYAGLMKPGPDGKLIPELAEGYTLSEDGKSYTFTLKKDLTFHDGEPLTADDVEFTIRKAIDPATKSIKRANWEGVTVSVLNPQQITFTLKQPYASFLESTTLGILPKHIWKSVSPEQFAFSSFNVNPVGSGPYTLKEVTKNSTGIAESYVFEPFSEYALGKPYISNITFKFYPSEGALLEAYGVNDVESINTLSPQKAGYVSRTGSMIEHATLPRIFGVFFNQNQNPLFTNKEVKQALNLATDRKEIIDAVLAGYGTAISGPVPAVFLGQQESFSTSTPEMNITAAKALLQKAGWKFNEATNVMEKKSGKTVTQLKFSISTSNAEELARAAEIVKKQWEQIGAQVEINTFEQGEFNQNILRPRKYDAVLFGEVIGRDLDLYAFWHSSQRNDPGANIALYTNSKADKLLESARTATDPAKRLEAIAGVESEIAKDIPAIFLYSPEFMYVIPSKVQNFQMSRITDPSERLANIEQWYIKTEHVWNMPFFIKNKKVINQ